MRPRTTLFLMFFCCLVLGATAGLAWAWVVAPPRPSNVSPAALNEVDRAIYLRLVADSYAAGGEQSTAGRRVAALGEQAESQLVALVAADLQSGPSSPAAIRLAALAVALGIDAPEVTLLAQPRPLPAATAEPAPEPVRTVATPLPLTDTRFDLTAQDDLCIARENTRRFEIIVGDANGDPLPGTAITVKWANGEETFYSGFKAGQSAGFVDFEMEPHTSYTVYVAGEQAGVIEVITCPDGRQGGRRLEFQERRP